MTNLSVDERLRAPGLIAFGPIFFAIIAEKLHARGNRPEDTPERVRKSRMISRHVESNILPRGGRPALLRAPACGAVGAECVIDVCSGAPGVRVDDNLGLLPGPELELKRVAPIGDDTARKRKKIAHWERRGVVGARKGSKLTSKRLAVGDDPHLGATRAVVVVVMVTRGSRGGVVDRDEN